MAPGTAPARRNALTNFWYSTDGSSVPNLGPGTASQEVPVRVISPADMISGLGAGPVAVDLEGLRDEDFPGGLKGGRAVRTAPSVSCPAGVGVGSCGAVLPLPPPT